jgi:hypothetical protein
MRGLKSLFISFEKLSGPPSERHISEGYRLLQRSWPFLALCLVCYNVALLFAFLHVVPVTMSATASGLLTQWVYMDCRRYAHAIIREGKG